MRGGETGVGPVTSPVRAYFFGSESPSEKNDFLSEKGIAASKSIARKPKREGEGESSPKKPHPCWVRAPAVPSGGASASRRLLFCAAARRRRPPSNAELVLPPAVAICWGERGYERHRRWRREQRRQGVGEPRAAVGWAADGEELEVAHHQIHANEFRPSHSTPISSMLVISATSCSTLAIFVPYRFMPVVNALRDGEGSLAQWGRERGAGERGRKRGAGGRGEGDGRRRRCDQWLRTKRWGAAAATAASYPRSSSPPLGPPPRRPSSSSDLRRRSSSSSAPSHHPPPQPLRRWPSPLRVEGRDEERERRLRGEAGKK